MTYTRRSTRLLPLSHAGGQRTQAWRLVFDVLRYLNHQHETGGSRQRGRRLDAGTQAGFPGGRVVSRPLGIPNGGRRGKGKGGREGGEARVRRPMQ